MRLGNKNSDGDREEIVEERMRNEFDQDTFICMYKFSRGVSKALERSYT